MVNNSVIFLSTFYDLLPTFYLGLYEVKSDNLFVFRE